MGGYTVVANTALAEAEEARVKEKEKKKAVGAGRMAYGTAVAGKQIDAGASSTLTAFLD